MSLAADLTSRVLVWPVGLDLPEEQVRDLAEALDSHEGERADRFRFQRDRRRFIVRRAALRKILGACVDYPPASLTFDYGPYGKPALSPRFRGAGLSFNLSHSGERALVAVTSGARLGVDLERIRPGIAIDEIAGRYFSRSEAETMRRLPSEQRAEAFFLCWTRKEAYIKAVGQGLSLPLEEFEVSLVPGEPAALLKTRGDPAAARRWTLRSLPGGPGYAAALCLEGPGRPVHLASWPEAIASVADDGVKC